MSPRRASSPWPTAFPRGALSVVAMLSMAGIVSSTSTGSAAATLTRVDVIGDSITSMAAPALEAALGSRYVVSISGRPGIEIGQDLSVIKSAPRARDWVIELGTNDAGLANPLALQALAAVVHMLARKHCVELVTVGGLVPGDDQLARALDVNMLLATEQHPRFHLVDWGDIEYQDPTWLEGDQVHPTPAGSTEFASLVATALATDCGS